MPDPTPGAEKAATLLLSLGVENSSKVLQHLEEHEIERVMLLLSQADFISKDAERAALAEAYEFSLASSSARGGGVEYVRQLLSRAVGPTRSAEILKRISAHKQSSSFEMLRNTDPAQAAKLLEDELPQTIALVLSYLEAKPAADILTHMPEELQIDVTLRLAMMDRVSPQVVQVVEHDLKNKMSGVIHDADYRSTGGVPFLVKMLLQIDRGVQKNIFTALESNNPTLAEEIRANMFTFDDLVKLDDRTMQRILRDVAKADLALSLKGAPERIKEMVFRNISERARENLKEEIEILGPQLVKNVYAAQRRVVDTVRALEEKGEIVINNGGGGDNEVLL